ncbi:phage regulatory CII family protein [Acerihabitans sp. TG2]|uniref:phage regulatory CII family protein n=1 Tax=Acerihabitans sp. TG2 TaxID=3096008 RepID=UPI002B237CB3|nr:phage regulatory CII family protein [Acerihabitans sp. TG2]MEA9389536.1 phage regulatory CII family protein [Acerihabitans sp. TG2]
MFDYQVSKHKNLENACRLFANAHKGELTHIAERIGMNPQVLRNKLNPDQPHQLTCRELLEITDATEDATLIDGLLAQLNCMPAVPINEAAAENIPAYVMRATAAIGSVAAETVSTERMTPSRKSALLESVNSGIRYLSLVGLTMHARVQSNPALAQTVDALSGIGASLGLS